MTYEEKYTRGHDLSTPSNAILVFESVYKQICNGLSGNCTAYVAKTRHAFAKYAFKLPAILIKFFLFNL